MELFLIGHNYKYAAEQIMLLLFPGERPRYPENPQTDFWAEIKLFPGSCRATAVCRLHAGGGLYLGRASVKRPPPGDKLLEDRYFQRIIKRAFYLAGIKFTGKKPPWGSVTGVRPGKLMSAYLNAGMSESAAKSAFMKEYDVSAQRASLCLKTARHSQTILNSLMERDICLYVGIPFCPTRCTYCSFVSQTTEKSASLVDPYIDALLMDIRETARQVKGAMLRVISVYIGGGTPTSLSPGQLDMLLSEIGYNFDLSACREFTVEAGRPDTITGEKLQALKDHGVTRISVNPQTMSDEVLLAIGRRHTARDTIKAMELVGRSGGFCVNMDLIAGLPGDSTAGFEKSLKAVISLGAENITVHTLSLKKGAGIMLQKTALPPEDNTRDMVDLSVKELVGAQYTPYYLYRQKYMTGALENTGWSISGFENIYNICIMEELCSIISMGAGGSTKLVYPGGKMLRRFAPKYPLEYTGSIDSILSRKAEIKEFYDGL